jgi:periplasmic protein TonB
MRSALFASFLLLAFVSTPAQQPKPEGPIYPVTGKGIKPPEAIFTPAPGISQDERKTKFGGIAIIAGYIGTDGLFHDAKVLRSTGDSTLDARALDTLKTWKFHPCTKDGKAVNCTLNLEVTFHLYRDHK